MGCGGSEENEGETIEVEEEGHSEAAEAEACEGVPYHWPLHLHGHDQQHTLHTSHCLCMDTTSSTHYTLVVTFASAIART